MENQHEKELRRRLMLGLSGMVASALLGTMFTYDVVTSKCKRELNYLRNKAVSERSTLYLNEWRRRLIRGEQVDQNELAKQYGIPLTKEGDTDYEALRNAMFPLEER